MTGTHYIIIVLAVLILFPLLFKLLAGSLSQYGFSTAKFPEAWEKFLHKHMPFFSKLPSSQQNRLRGKLKVLIAEKELQSFDGLIRSDEMKIGILAYAALISLRHKTLFEDIETLHIYPQLPEGKKTHEGNILNFAWSDENGTPNPYSVWIEMHAENYQGNFSKEEFINFSKQFFSKEQDLSEEVYSELEKFYSLNPKIWL